MKRFFVLLVVGTLLAGNSLAWNRLGHDIGALIAEKYLTKKAKKNMTKYLEGHNIVWFASYMDYMGYIYKLGLSNEWYDHTVPVDKDFNYAPGEFGTSGGKQNGDAIMCVEKAVKAMKDGGYKALPDSVVNLYLKWLIHFVPDAHCPSHTIYNFRSTNYHVTVGSQKLLFHGIWDGMPDVHGLHHWSASEYRDELTFNLTKAQKKAIEMDGDIAGWIHESAKDCIVAYDIVRPEGMTDADKYNATVLVEKQLLRGGIRLAYLLNMIFGK